MKVNEKTLSTVLTAVRARHEVVYDMLEDRQGNRPIVWFRQTLHIETTNCQYLLGYDEEFKIEAIVSELVPSYGGGYEWAQRSVYHLATADEAIAFIKEWELDYGY